MPDEGKFALKNQAQIIKGKGKWIARKDFMLTNLEINKNFSTKTLKGITMSEHPLGRIKTIRHVTTVEK